MTPALRDSGQAIGEVADQATFPGLSKVMHVELSSSSFC
jgi:hypothetical protein